MFIPIILFIAAMGTIANSQPRRVERHVRRGF